MDGFDRITADPNILGGAACIRSMRIPVSLIANLASNGMTADEIMDDYPDLEPEDIWQALRYSGGTARLARGLLKPDEAPPTDAEVRESYADHLIEKYLSDRANTKLVD